MIGEHRPSIDVPFTRSDHVLEILGGTGALVLLIGCIAGARLLPDTVPVHFGFRGEITAYGSPGSLAIVAFFGIAGFVGLSILARLSDSYNYPWRITFENAETQYRLGRRLVLLLGACYTWTFVGIMARVAVVALDLEWATTPVQVARGSLLAFAVVSFGWYVVAAGRRR